MKFGSDIHWHTRSQQDADTSNKVVPNTKNTLWINSLDRNGEVICVFNWFIWYFHELKYMYGFGSIFLFPKITFLSRMSHTLSILKSITWPLSILRKIFVSLLQHTTHIPLTCLNLQNKNIQFFIQILSICVMETRDNFNSTIVKQYYEIFLNMIFRWILLHHLAVQNVLHQPSISYLGMTPLSSSLGGWVAPIMVWVLPAPVCP